MPAEKISYALNQRLPEDIVVQDSCEVPDTFHPRFSRSRKTYEYRILNRRFRMPTRRLDTYFYHYPLDVEKMQEAADYLVGEHDLKVSVRSMHRRKPACAPSMRVRSRKRGYYHDPGDGKWVLV